MKYSVLIPTYKAAFLAKCIDSILAQSYEDFELVIVNDASPENIDEIVAKYSDPRIRYYMNAKNCGAVDVVDNWNICLGYAKGDFVICMGDDDELSTDCLEQYNLLMDDYPNLDIYHARTKIIDENSEFVTLQEERPKYETVFSLMLHKLSGQRQFIGDFLYKRSTLLENGGFYKLPMAWGSDDISAYIAACSHGIANTQKPTFYYRENRQTISRSGDATVKIEAINREEEWYNGFANRNFILSDIEQMYLLMIREKLKVYFQKKKLYLIAGEISIRGFFRYIHWLRSRHVSGLSSKETTYALIEGLKMYYKNK